MTQPIKRLVVSLDAVSETGLAIDTAARLAARWHVPLHGVFIEDEELIGRGANSLQRRTGTVSNGHSRWCAAHLRPRQSAVSTTLSSPARRPARLAIIFASPLAAGH